MPGEIELPLLFTDSDVPVVVRKRDLIAKCTVLVNAIESQSPDWMETGCKVDLEHAIQVPFKRAAGDFLFSYALKYECPDMENEEPKLENYVEANKKSPEELKEILEFANFLECYSFMHSIGFVLAKKLEEKPIEEIAAFLGVECKPEGHMFDENDGWIHPPSDTFRNGNNPQ